jgi:pyrophosphate--fructose-6-phosphate 1-phosphotransferase
VINYVADIICKRSALGKNYGIILIPEGLIEFITETSVLIKEINEIIATPYTDTLQNHVEKNLSK